MSVSSQISVRDAASRKLERIAAKYEKLERSARAADTATRLSGRNTVEAYDRAGRSVNSASENIDEFNRRQRAAGDQASTIGGLWNNIGGYIKAAGAALGLSKLGDLSDTLSSNRARLSLIIDDGGSVDALDKEIYASAMRARTAYTDTAAVISKLGLTAGDAFTGTDEMIAFTELMSKNFAVGGASSTERASAMYQLTQAMASGRLQGDEYRSIIENAPLLAKAIEDYMRNVQGATGTMKEWASEGMLTADVIKAAMFQNAQEVEDRFAKLPMTLAQIGTMAGNMVTKALNPLLTGINWVANNISIIGPMVLGLGTAFTVFQVAAHWTQIATVATGAYHTVVNLLSIGFGVLTGKTAAASAAVFTYNSALLASPITWLVMGIALLIAALYAGVAAYNKFTDSSVSATGIIGGAFAVLGAHMLDTFIVPLWNSFASIANFFGNVFNDPVAAVQVLFYDMVLTVLGYITNMAHGIETLINKIPGVKVNITSGLDNFYNSLETVQKAVKDKSGWTEYVKKMDFFDYSNAASAGYNFGEGVAEKIAGVFSGADSTFDLSGIASSLDDVAINTGKMANEVHIADEDLQFFKDVAEMRYVQNFVTLTPSVSMNAQISEKVDVKSVVHEISVMLDEQIASSAEGVFA